MKKIAILTAMLVLTISLLTGCGCTRRGAGMDTMPSTEMTILPTNIPETTAPIIPTTEPATVAPTEDIAEPDIIGTDDGMTDNIIGDSDMARNRIR